MSFPKLTLTDLAIGVAAAAALLFLMRAVANRPLAVVGGLLQNLLFGTFGLLALDYAGKSLGVHVPLNFATLGAVGVLGLPGVVAVAVINQWIV